jgi:hypothetical protein
VEIGPGTLGYWMGIVTLLLAPLGDAVRLCKVPGTKVVGAAL